MAMWWFDSKVRIERAWSLALSKMDTLLRILIAVMARASWYVQYTRFQYIISIRKGK